MVFLLSLLSPGVCKFDIDLLFFVVPNLGRISMSFLLLLPESLSIAILLVFLTLWRGVLN